MIERRTHDGLVEYRKADGPPMIVGHAAVFDKLSENLGGFVERIAPGAFDPVMSQDVRALIDHNMSLVLGRVSAGTLKLTLDEVGLRYDVTPSDTSYARDLLANIEARNITQSSFGFVVDDADWAEDGQGRVVRTIKRLKTLVDVSPVTFPAYADTDVSKRAFDAYVTMKNAVTFSKRNRMMKETDLLELLARI